MTYVTEWQWSWLPLEVRGRDNQYDPGQDDRSLAGMFEIDRGAALRYRLDLAQPPIRLARVVNETSWNETLGHSESSVKVGGMISSWKDGKVNV